MIGSGNLKIIGESKLLPTAKGQRNKENDKNSNERNEGKVSFPGRSAINREWRK
jgi:hypothetical protein